MPRWNEIDAEILIAEVQSRPPLYYASGLKTNQRRKCWDEVAAVFFPDKWPTAGRGERDKMVREVMVRWKSLRDSYGRHVRNGAKGNSPRYFERLEFLAGHVRTSTYQPQIKIYLPDDSNQSDEAPHFDDSSADNENAKDEEMMATTDALADATERDANVTSILYDLLQKQKESGADRMGNRHFLMSLLPFMEKLPDDVNLEVRLQLMSVLQRYNSDGGSSFGPCS